MALRYRDVAAISLQVLFFILLLLDQLQLVSTKKEDKSATYSVPVPPPTLEDNQTLYFSSNGWKYGIHTYVGGMYGGNMKVKDHGDSRNMSVVNLECFFATGGQVIIKTDHLKTRSMAFDPIGNQVLFHIYDKRRLSAYLFPRCHFGDMCNYKEIKKNERYQARTLFSYSVTMDRSATCETEIQPFGMYDYDVYFIAKRHIKETLRVELRKLVGCEYEQFHSQNPFQIDRCSLHIITLEETTPDRCDYVKLTNNILVVKKDGRKHYLVQIFNRTQSSFEVVLVVGTKDSKNGVPVRHLYREPLPYNYHEFTDEGRHLGGISYKFGKLCWSAVTRILCADWDIEGGLQNIESVLHPWQAADSICNVGSDVKPELANITTGVTIVSVHPEDGIALYFGCQQEETKYGGAGLLRMLPDTGAPVLFPLQQRYKKIHAGTLFLTKTCNLSSASAVAPIGMFVTLLCVFVTKITS